MRFNQKSAGFSLLEVMVALAVFSIAALALLNVQRENVRTSTALQERAFANIVAENTMVEVMAGLKPLRAGTQVGEAEMAGQIYQYAIRIRERTDIPVFDVTVSVSLGESGQVLSELSAIRRRL